MDACTIISSNYLPLARTMVQSYRRYHPDGRMFVLLLDRPNDTDLSGEPWETVYADELGLGDELKALRMLYDGYELSMALRPAFVLYLMREKGVEHLAMMDSDLYFTGKLEGADALLKEHAISICVSIRKPIPEDGFRPQDNDFILAGSLNGGFIICRKCDETIRTMEWLWGKLRKSSFYRPYEGFFGDQKWLDLWPSLMDTLGIIKRKEWNVACWNMHERPVTKENGVYRAGGVPMAFFHFSGYRPDEPDVLSMHQNRYDIRALPAVHELAGTYRSELLGNGYDEWKERGYGWNSFENGVAVSGAIRRAYEEIDGPRRFPEPHKAGRSSFFEWLLLPYRRNTPLNNLHLSIWRLSLEARVRFPDPMGKDLSGFAQWILHERKRELGLNPVFTASIRTMPRMRMSPRQYMKTLLALRHVFEPYQQLCRIVKKLIGKDLYDRIKPKRSREFGYEYFRLHLTPKRPEGITMVSAMSGENGVAEGARGLVKAFRAAGIPTEHVDSRTAPGRQDAVSPQRRLHWYDTTILSGGMLEIRDMMNTTEMTIGPNQRMIAYVPWESQKMEPDIAKGLNTFYEIWTPSEYSANAIRKHLTTPVCVLPYAVDVRSAAPVARKAAGFRDGTFAMLFAFDFYSEIQRKNPKAAIDAFVKAFGSDPATELLIIGTHAADFRHEADELKSLVGAHKNIRFSPEHRPRAEILGIMQCCNCYLSLHRSEGFGLTIAEAMALGVPTVATDFGGCRDFLTEKTGWPVRYTIARLHSAAGPYPAGTEWAEADTDAAAAALRNIRADEGAAKKRAEAGAAFMRTEYSSEAVGRKTRTLLKR